MRRLTPSPARGLPVRLALAVLLAVTVLPTLGQQTRLAPAGHGAAQQAACVPGTELVVNGGFESPGLGDATEADDYQPDGWTGTTRALIADDIGGNANVRAVNAGGLSQVLDVRGLPGARLIVSLDPPAGDPVTLDGVLVTPGQPAPGISPRTDSVVLGLPGIALDGVSVRIDSCGISPFLSGLDAAPTTAEDIAYSDTFAVERADLLVGTGATIDVAVTQGEHGTVSVAGTGLSRRVTYVPDLNASGPDTFSVSLLVDGQAIDTVEVTISVTPINDPPVFVDASVPARITTPSTGRDGATVSWTMPTATDPDGTTPTVSCDRQPGSLFPPGTTIVTCTARDGQGQTDTVSFPVTVTGAAPTISVNGGPRDGATYTAGSVPAASTCTARDNQRRAIPCTVSGYSTAVGPQTLTFTATDSTGVTATLTRTYTVTDGPVVVPSASPTSTSPGTRPARSPRPSPPITGDVPAAPAEPAPVAPTPPAQAPAPPAAEPSTRPARPPRGSEEGGREAVGSDADPRQAGRPPTRYLAGVTRKQAPPRRRGGACFRRLGRSIGTR